MLKTYIEIDNITKSYKQGDELVGVLNNFSMTLNEGDFLSITGPSGSGKTTLLNILGLIDNFDFGDIRHFGKNTKDLHETEKNKIRMNSLGFVYQSNNLFDEFNAVENVALPLILSGKNRKDSYQESESMLIYFGLGHRLKHTPKDLSGGEQQRVAIARALINKPDVVIADEPTGNLDKATSKNVFQYFLNYLEKNSCAVVMATHNLELAGLANKKLELNTLNE
jgi:lipoprotein-releasing system ATP-binding protein